jgi:hexokinase
MTITPAQPADIAIPQSQMKAKTGSELFAWVAQEIEKFLERFHKDDIANHRSDKPYKLGFSFSHAYEQQGPNKGILLRWSKSFDIPDAIGKDVCAMLQCELAKLDLPVVVTTLINDATGTLLCRSYEAGGQPRTILGAIFGTGTNGAYFEKLENIKRLKGMGDVGYDRSTGEMIINTEWAAFDNEMLLLPNTDFDQAVDNSCSNPAQEMFEKRISGLYLGEILRRVILRLYSMPQDGDVRLPRPLELRDSPLNIPWGIDSSFLSELVSDESSNQDCAKSAVRYESKFTSFASIIPSAARGPEMTVSSSYEATPC